MRGKADSSDIYPFEVKKIEPNLPVTKGGFTVFKVNTQEFVEGAPVRETYAQAMGDASNYKKGLPVHE